MPYAALREQVWEATRKLCDSNLIRLSAGNVGLRAGENALAITPSAVRYDVMRPEDIVIMGLHGEVIDALPGRRPSSEWRLHGAILRGLPEVRAIVHTHSVYAMTFAALGREIPVINLELYAAGGPIPVAPYACPGTDAVGEGAAAVFGERPALKALLLQNHGLVAVGATLDEAHEMAYDVEVGAQTAYQALQLGTPCVLTGEQIDEIRRVYRAPARRGG